MSTQVPRSTAAATPAAPTRAPVRPDRKSEPHRMDDWKQQGTWGHDFSAVRTRSADQPVPEHGLPQPARDVVRRPGVPLPEALRDDAERRFRHDFSHVRVHTDPGAARSARALGAHAFTVGHHIAFAAGRFDPATPAGARLLTHELAHVAQQDLGAAGHTHGAAAESEAALLARDPSTRRRVRVGARVGMHRSEDHQILEEDTRAYYYPPSYRPQMAQKGVDLVLGGSAPEYTQTTNPKERGRVEVLERVTGGTWIQIKRLTPQDDMSIGALQRRVRADAAEAVVKFRGAITHPEDAKNMPMEGAKWEGKTPVGTWNRTVLQKPDRLLIHIEVPGYSSKSPRDQELLRAAAEGAAKGARFGRIPLRIVLVDPPPSVRGMALARVKLAGRLAGRLPVGLKVLAAVSTLLKVYKAVEFVKIPFAVYDSMLAAQWQAEQAGQGRPFILLDETQKVEETCRLLADARAEQDTYSEELRDLTPLFMDIGASGDLDAIRNTSLRLLSNATVTASRLTDVIGDIGRLENYKKRAEQRRDVADRLLTVSHLIHVIHPSTGKQVDLWHMREDLQKLANLSTNAINDATELRDRLTDDDNWLTAWTTLFRDWYGHFEALAQPPPNTSAAPPAPTP
ncbi:eCIS core domain-containing protein [Streptomyces anulatus]|uniref:eCIS core domain-containing protein n=1 Tax=Streptomyces anulatus TaxID=1892 RepID=UPI0036D97BC7